MNNKTKIKVGLAIVVAFAVLYSSIIYASTTKIQSTLIAPASSSDTLTMVSSPAGAGVLTPAAGTYDFSKLAAKVVRISEQPVSGYTFVGWTGTGRYSYTGPNQTAIIPMYESVTEVANYR